MRRRATAETADIVREANAITVRNHLDTIRSLQREAEAAPSPEAGSGLAAVRALRAESTVDPLTASPARLRELAAAARPVETPAS